MTFKNSHLRIWLWMAIAWAQFIVLVVAATYFSLVPDPGDTFDPYSDTVLHFVCWFVLLLSLFVAVRRETITWKPAGALWLYSGAIEIVQGLMPPRQASIIDFLFNGIGIASAICLVLLCAPLYRRIILVPLQNFCATSNLRNIK